jgi:hypothetical protein
MGPIGYTKMLAKATNISEQFKKNLFYCLTVEDGTDWLTPNVGKSYQHFGTVQEESSFTV